MTWEAGVPESWRPLVAEIDAAAKERKSPLRYSGMFLAPAGRYSAVLSIVNRPLRKDVPRVIGVGDTPVAALRELLRKVKRA